MNKSDKHNKADAPTYVKDVASSIKQLCTSLDSLIRTLHHKTQKTEVLEIEDTIESALCDGSLKASFEDDVNTYKAIIAEMKAENKKIVITQNDTNLVLH